jgi:hypothetical protein
MINHRTVMASSSFLVYKMSGHAGVGPAASG